MSVDDEDDGSGAPVRRLVLTGGGGLVLLALIAAGAYLMVSGDPNPPHKVNELQIVAITPPPPAPPPPPPPPKQQQPEEKMIEQTPVKQEIPEEKPMEQPKETLPDNDEPPPGPLGLDDAGKGPGELLGRPGGRGLIGGGGGGGGGASRFGWYASIVQAQIEAALRSNEKTRHAVLQIQVRLWPDSSGRINRVQLVSSSGNGELDVAIRDQILGGMTLREPPPKDMPLPIVTNITARTPG